MKASALFIAAVIASCALLSPQPAWGQSGNLQAPVGWGQRAVHDPSSSRYIDMRPNGMQRRGTTVPTGRIIPGSRGNVLTMDDYIDWRWPGRWRNNWRWNNGWGWGVYEPIYYGVGPFYGPQNRTGFVAPLAAPAYGYYENFSYGADPQPAAVTAPPRNGSGNNTQGTVADLPRSNPDRRQLAMRFVGFGDQKFAEGEYVQAQSNYRKAIQAAADIPQPYFHRAQALIGQGRYELAVEVLEQAIELDPQLATVASVMALYDGQLDARREHLEKLQDAVSSQPGNGDAAIAAGWQLLLVGRRAEAHELFRQAARLSGYGSMLAILTEASAPPEQYDDPDAPSSPAAAQPQAAQPRDPLRTNFPGAQPPATSKQPETDEEI